MSTESKTPAAPVTAGATVETTADETAASIAATLVSEQPDVQPHAIEQAESVRASDATKDKYGNAFDSKIHATNADGTPRKTVRGAWALKRGNKGKSAPAPTSNGIVLPGATSGASAKEQEARAAGAGAANLLLALSVGLGGQEWQPRYDEKTGQNEKLMLEHAFGEYFVSKQWGDLPPGLALCAALSMYALPRFAMPQTRTRFQKFKEWSASKYGAWKARRMARRRGVPESNVERADREAREQFRREYAAHEASKRGTPQ
jgi:hypothetical protein